MTLENINATLKTNFTLVKRDGTVNESNARIVKRLAGLTEADLAEFMKTDGWNMSASEKHAKGYHALRALDKWYKEHGSESDSETPSETPSGRPSDGIPSAGTGTGNGSESESESESGNGSEMPSEESESGSGSSESGSGNGSESESGSENESESESGAGNGSEESESESGSEESENGSESDSESESETPSETPSESGSEESETPSRPNPNIKLTDTEKQVLAMITRPQADGRPNNVYLHGPAGTGKSYTVKRIADAIGAGYWETGIVTMKEELLGFENVKGYVEPECVKILKNGKAGHDITIMLFDEFDGMPNSVTLTWNNIFASRRFTTMQGTFDVHPSVRFVATGNTTMDGADADYDRETVDKSVKTRWLFKAVDYDKKVERKLADADVVEFLQGLRRAKDNCGLDLMVTYREFTALQWSKAIIADGIMDMESALDSCVFKGLTADDKDTLRNDRMMQKLIDKGNEWAKAF